MPTDIPNPRLYRALQYGGWATYAAIGSIIQFSFAGPNPKFALLALIGSAILCGFTNKLRTIANRNRWAELGIGPLSVRVFGATLAITAASQLLVSAIMIWPLKIMGGQEYKILVLFLYIFQTQVILLLWSALYFGFKYFRNYKAAEVERWRLEAIAKEAELLSLKSQIDPHFIFNSLNNIRSLVLEDADKAREMITRLSELLRYVLKFSRNETVPFEQELAIVKDYLALESIQLEGRLRSEIEIATDTLAIEVPPMALQLLVENAIKHGINHLPEGGSIRIRATVNGDSLRIQVLNTGQLLDPKTSSSAIGLENLRSRLALLYAEGASLALSNADSENVSATLILPPKPSRP